MGRILLIGYCGKPEGKRQFERPKHIWLDYIKMDLGEIELGGAERLGLALDRE
jgi:hypothetical protein